MLLTDMSSTDLLNKLITFRNQAIQFIVSDENHHSVRNRIKLSLKMFMETVSLIHNCFISKYLFLKNIFIHSLYSLFLFILYNLYFYSFFIFFIFIINIFLFYYFLILLSFPDILSFFLLFDIILVQYEIIY